MNDIDIWNKFCNTYDITILSNLSVQGKEVIKQYINTNDVKFIGLKRILELYFNNSINNIKQCNNITPIRTLSYHTSTKYNKKIYIFGEQHYVDETCTVDKCNILKFITNNIINIPKFIDVFLEMSYITKDYKETYEEYKYRYDKKFKKAILDTFKLKFYNCFTKNKCKYPNIRFHYTDIRNATIKNHPYFITLDAYIYNILLFFSGIITEDNLISSLNILKNLLTNDLYKNERINFNNHITSHKKLIEYLLQIYSQFKLEKQQKYIIYDDVKNILLEYFNDTISKINLSHLNLTDMLNLINSFGEFIKTKEFNKFDVSIKKIHQYAKTWAYLTVPLMDIYLFSRLFRNFEKIKYKYSDEPKNIIIYVGDEHADRYRKMLEKLKFNQDFYQTKRNKFNDSCINISNLKQPLFN